MFAVHRAESNCHLQFNCRANMGPMLDVSGGPVRRHAFSWNAPDEKRHRTPVTCGASAVVRRLPCIVAETLAG